MKKINNRETLTRVKEVILLVEQVSNLDQIPHFKKLVGGGSYYRIRVGDYRIGLELEGETLHLIRFLHRKDVYRYFPPMALL